MPQPATVASLPSVPAYQLPPSEKPRTDSLGSAYINDDSPIYDMALRLYGLGYLDSAFIGMRPWTRRSLLHMLQKTEPDIMADNNEQAVALLARLKTEMAVEAPPNNAPRGTVYGIESVYTRFLGIGGQSLRDSFHIGQTISNDYGRPYEPGFNNITGFSTLNESGRFSLFIRGEYQHTPSSTGYDYDLASYFACADGVCPFAPPNFPQATVPYGSQPAQNYFRLIEATLSFHLLGHEISGGKSDAWLGPAYGGAMAWSNNAENIYSFRINRVEPLYIPWASKILGPLRYDFFVGSLKGHTFPNSPWVHSEMFSFRPTSNFEYGFQRTVIWGGAGHVPVTLHTFLRSFFSLNDTEGDPYDKNSPNDPGARFSDFNFSYRIPFVRKYLTLYADSFCHDDVSPISAPRRAAYRTGLYLSQFPGLRKLDMRVEAANTDPDVARSTGGTFFYQETVQRQGYTNKGLIMGDWMGREGKGGNAWLTYHLSPNEWVQFEYMRKKNANDFIPDGTTQNQYKFDVVKRLLPQLQMDAWLQIEHWKAPIYKTDAQTDTAVAVQLTWFPKLRTTTALNGK
jgi:Capsule assembly protein Wzi